MTSPDAKPTFHSQSNRDAFDHVKIIDGMGTFRKESAAVPSVNTPSGAPGATAPSGAPLLWRAMACA
jgi:hypothetical protein